ncbi:MAG TPA: protein-L-isoaspartate O-methyltransferase [Bauldia sp.]|nr:protein-L-isoaspartate O-methyltransferase [Bauldia sp.]
MDFAAARLKMLDSQVRTEDVTDYALISAMGTVAREDFVPENLRQIAYIDDDLLLTPVGARPRRYLMRPASFARMVQLLELTGAEKALIVGAANGYSAAVLARLVRNVVALEEDGTLADGARRALSAAGIANVNLVTGPLNQGVQNEAPFDAILVEGAVEQVPDALLNQLTEGGRLVAVVTGGSAPTVVLYTRSAREVGARPTFNVPARALPGFERPKAFIF